MKAGFGKGTIRFPQEFFPQEGFRGVHDDPHVRLMVLQFADNAFALLEGELVIIPQSAIDRWRKRISEAFAIPYEQTVVQMTHAITTPHEPGPLGPPDKRPEPTEEDLRKRRIYHDVTDRAVEEAIAQARRSFGDAVLGWGSGECAVNVNCDVETPFGWWLGADPAGYSDHTLRILRVNGIDGSMKGMFVSFGMKPAAIDNAGRKENARLVSSEIAGAFCEKLEKRYGVPVIYSVSAGGNQLPRVTALKYEVTENGEVIEHDEGPEQGFRYAETLAEEMCRAAIPAIDAIDCKEADGSTAWTSAVIRWERRRGGPRKLRKVIDHTQAGEVELTAEVFTLGDTAFVLVRPEMTAECGRYLMERSPYEKTILMTLTNGEMKCLPDAKSFERGTYEAQGSNLMPGAAEALLDTIIQRMEETK